MSKNEEYSELEERVHCLEAIINRISEGVLLTDRDCRIVVFNPAKADMEQISAADVIGKYSWEPYTHSNKEISEHKYVLDTGIPIVNAYRPHAYIGDMPVYIHYSTYPVVKDEKVIGVYSVSRNETILKNLLYEILEQKRKLNQANAVCLGKARLAKGTNFHFSDIIGSSQSLTDVIREAQTVATLDAPLLLIGETGTGKEVFAQSIHNLGRPDKKFVAINCAAIPENLIESILFGAKKGAYTGSVDMAGLFEEAGDGTLFLDEINSMSTSFQAKLLRALQERCVRPVGGLHEIPIRCRLIFASNEQPQELIREKRMRIDLFYRIAGFCLFIPPLRERREDIAELADYFIGQCNREFQKNIKTVSDELKAWLCGNYWAGNTRELQHFIENIMLCVPDTANRLTLSDIPEHMKKMANAVLGIDDKAEIASDYMDTDNLNGTLKGMQRQIILNRLKRFNYNITKTAESLGIFRQNLLMRMKRLDILKPE